MTTPHSYEVGQRVRALRTLTQGATDELPAQHFCDRGDVLIVRKIGRDPYPIGVSHEEITDRSFGMNPDEIEPAPEGESNDN